MKKMISLLLVLILVAALALTPVLAEKGNGTGGGGGNGNGESPLSVAGVTIGDKDLKDAEIDPSGEITVKFDRGMSENKDVNVAAISIADAETTVTFDGDRTFTVAFKDLKEGDHELVIAKTAKANNGKELGEDYKVAFKVKAAEPEEEPHEKSCPSKDFSDVNKDVNNWTHLPIDYVLTKKYMAGEPNNKFNPTGDVSRAMVVQVLYAREAKPKAEKKAGFKDVVDGSWYVDAVNWAAENKIVAGFEDGNFKPNDSVTREQLALIFQKYAEYKKLDTKKTDDLSKFKDKDTVSKWAVDGVKWAVGDGIISGTVEGNSKDLLVAPKAKSNRAQLAVMLKAFDEKVDAAEGPDTPEENPDPSESPAPSESPVPAESPAPSASEAPQGE